MSSCTAACVVGGLLPSCELGTWQPCFQPQTPVGHPPTPSIASSHHVLKGDPSATSSPLLTRHSHTPSDCLLP